MNLRFRKGRDLAAEKEDFLRGRNPRFKAEVRGRDAIAGVAFSREREREMEGRVVRESEICGAESDW